jgi:hypothetical protein
MKIDGKVHCFFEQSGTFKNEFKKLGIPAEDYDIQNNFGETDHVVDLFSEIEKEYDNLTRHKTQDTRHKTQDTRHKTQDIICRNQSVSRPCYCFFSLYLFRDYEHDVFFFRFIKQQTQT